MPTLIESAPARSAPAAFLVAMLQAMACTALESRLMRLTANSTQEEWPCAVSTTIRSTPASINRSVRSKPPSPTVVAAAPQAACASCRPADARPPSMSLTVSGRRSDIVVDDQELFDAVLA